MKFISEKQKAEIIKIVENGKHRNSHGKLNIEESAIFCAFVTYIRMRNLFSKSFKLKQFRKERCRGGYMYPYRDCPLSRGQLLVAIRFGKRHGYLKQISDSESNHVWCFTGKELEV